MSDESAAVRYISVCGYLSTWLDVAQLPFNLDTDGAKHVDQALVCQRNVFNIGIRKLDRIGYGLAAAVQLAL